MYYAEAETFDSATPAPSSSTYYWNVGSLASRGTYHVTVRTIAGNAEIDSDACATADNGEDACAQNVVFVGSTIAAAAPTTAAAIPSATAYASGGKEFGVWIWDTLSKQSSGYAAQALSSAGAYGFNAVYLTIDDYLAIAALPDGAEKSAQTSAFEAKLAAFVKAAQAKGIAVDVEGGAKDWAEPDNRWQGYALIDFVKHYNADYPSLKVRGLQYDVESYLEPSYDGNQAAVLKNFIAFIDASAARMKGVDANFTVVIPHFYDAKQAWTPAFAYNGMTAHAFTHLLSVLAQKPGSEIIIMAYRNSLGGSDGTLTLSGPEMTEAATSSTKVVIAQETGNVSPDYVTFYGTSKSDLFSALTGIADAYGSYADFGGVAVHYLDPFLALK
jgi:hypothetical protein